MQAKKIAEINDSFRQHFRGGRILTTCGVQQLDEDMQVELFKKVREYHYFDKHNDPHDEHDFGVICMEQEKFFWKIDYYDLDTKFHSPDPANIELTNRVLTIMLAAEY